MPVRRLSLAISPVLRFAEWLFAGEASGADLFYLGASLWWLFLMLFRPEVFDVLPLVGMDWAPDGFWIVFVSSVAVLHAVALWRPRRYRLRMATTCVSAWYWLTIAISLSRPGISTGSGMYTLFGFGAVMLTIYLSGRDQHRG